MPHEVLNAQLISLALVHEPSNNIRKHFDSEAQAELVRSVKMAGVIEPILVRTTSLSGSFEIVAGSRRYRAAKAAGLKDIPCVIRMLDDRQALELMGVENVQRQNLLATEEAEWFKRMLAMDPGNNDGRLNVPDLAKQVGMSEKYVYDRLKLLELEAKPRKALEEGKITAGHAIIIARQAPEVQLELLEQATNFRNPSTVQDLENDLKYRKQQQKWKLEDAARRKQQAKDAKKNKAAEAKRAKQAAKNQAKQEAREQREAFQRRVNGQALYRMIAATKKVNLREVGLLVERIISWREDEYPTAAKWLGKKPASMLLPRWGEAKVAGLLLELAYTVVHSDESNYVQSSERVAFNAALKEHKIKLPAIAKELKAADLAVKAKQAQGKAQSSNKPVKNKK